MHNLAALVRGTELSTCAGDCEARGLHFRSISVNAHNGIFVLFPGRWKYSRRGVGTTRSTQLNDYYL